MKITFSLLPLLFLFAGSSLLPREEGTEYSSISLAGKGSYLHFCIEGNSSLSILSSYDVPSFSNNFSLSRCETRLINPEIEPKLVIFFGDSTTQVRYHLEDVNKLSLSLITMSAAIIAALA